MSAAAFVFVQGEADRRGVLPQIDLRLEGLQFWIDPSNLIASQASVSLSDVVEGEKAYPVRLDIIEWKSATNRTLYLCNDKGFPLTEVERRFHISVTVPLGHFGKAEAASGRLKDCPIVRSVEHSLTAESNQMSADGFGGDSTQL